LAIDKNAKEKVIKMIDAILNKLLASIPAATPIGNSKKII
jgi:polyribonucleotide nucleotidyltransferase